MKPIIILLRPQLGKNIGSVARVMLNFGFTSLRIVSPRSGWPDENALSTSAGAEEVLANAQIYDNLESAISDINILYATTARGRSIEKPVVSSREISKHYNPNYKTAIMFGAENNGLSNEELILADKLIYIDTNKDFGSLNISQAVGIIVYELSTKVDIAEKSSKILSNKKELIDFFDLLEKKLESKNFFKIHSRKTKLLKIKNIFTKIDPLTERDVKLLNAIINIL